MFEICKDFSSAAEICDPLNLFPKTLGGIRIFPQAQLEKVGGLDSRRLNLLTFSVAKRNIPLAKRREHFIGKPRYVPKFESRA